MMRNRKNHIEIGLIGLCLCLALIACMGEKGSGPHSSTSVTTGNPAGIKIIFKDDSMPVHLNGRAEIYASTQIPVPNYQQSPLATIAFSGSNEVTIDSMVFQSIHDSLWPKSSIGADSIYRFNAVILGETSGSILYGFGFDKSKSRFILLDQSNPAIENGWIVKTGDLRRNVELKCHIDPETISSVKAQFLYVVGTGFISRGENGNFAFPSIPDGSYNPVLIPIPRKSQGSVSAPDVLHIYGMNEPATTGIINELSIQATIDSIPFSGSLKEID